MGWQVGRLGMILTNTRPCSREVNPRVRVALKVQLHRVQIRLDLLLLIIGRVEEIRKATAGGEPGGRPLCVRWHSRVTRRLDELRRAHRQEVRAARITRRVENVLVGTTAARRRGIAGERPHAVVAGRDHYCHALQAELHDLVASPLGVRGGDVGLALLILGVRVLLPQGSLRLGGGDHLHLRRKY